MTAQLSREDVESFIKQVESDMSKGWEAQAFVLKLAKHVLAGMDSDKKLRDFAASQTTLGADVERALAGSLHDLYLGCDTAPPAPVAVSNDFDELVRKNCLNCQREHRITHYSLKDCCPYCGSYEWDIAKPLGNAPAPVALSVSKNEIRQIFMNNGFTIKEGQTDLKDYVYDAAFELISSLKLPAPVALPDEMYWQDAPVEGPTRAAAYATGWNACRAAMLKAGPVAAAAVPDGWKLVPVEPTAEMLASAKEWFGLTATAEGVYGKMIEAAPPAPEQDV